MNAQTAPVRTRRKSRLSQSRYLSRDDRRKALIGLTNGGDGGPESTEKTRARRTWPLTIWQPCEPISWAEGAQCPQDVDATGPNDPIGVIRGYGCGDDGKRGQEG